MLEIYANSPKMSTKPNRSITDNKTSGITNFGENNNYPEMFENLILSSETASACVDTLTSFIYGDGFKDQTLNNIKVNDNQTLEELLIDIARSLAMYNGVYVHTNKNVLNQVTDVHVIPFCKCRLSIRDDWGYASKIAVKNTWLKTKNFQQNNKVTFYNKFSDDDQITLSEIQQAGGIENWKGQVLNVFTNNMYAYPLNTFDPVADLLAVEDQVNKYKLNEISQGFSKKTIFYVERDEDKAKNLENKAKVEQFMGPEGDKCLVVGASYKEDGTLDTSSFSATQLEANVDPNLFNEAFEKSVTNSIRKCAYNIPTLLIDSEAGGLGSLSGEYMKSAVKFYNISTTKLRTLASAMLKRIFTKTTITSLEGKDFEIQERNIQIEDDQENILTKE